MINNIIEDAISTIERNKRSFINWNNRPDFIFQSASELFSKENAKRITSIVLPFLAFNPTTAALSSFGVSVYQCYDLWNTTPDKTTTGHKWGDAALLVTTATFGYFFPAQQFLYSNGFFFATHLYKVLKKDNSWQERGSTALQITLQAIHFASTCYGTSALLVLSLISQASSELIQACNQGQKGQYPEMIASLLLSAIRLRKASIHLLPKKEISASEWEDFYNNHLLPLTERSPEIVNLADLLKTKGFSNVLRNIDFSNTEFEYVSFAGLHCTNCDFARAKFDGVLVGNFKATCCRFNGAKWSPLDYMLSIDNMVNTRVGCIKSKPLVPNSIHSDPKPQPAIELPKKEPLENAEKSDRSSSLASEPTIKVENASKTDPITTSPTEVQPPIVQQPLKKLTQADWDELKLDFSNHRYYQASNKLHIPTTNDLLDVAALLKQKGFSTEIEGLKIKYFYFHYCLFQNINFKNCKFADAGFNNCSFNQVTAEGCNFEKSLWEKSSIQQSIFTNCNFYKSKFCSLSMDTAQILTSSFEKSFFDSSSLKDSFFSGCDFTLAIIYRSFYENMTLAKCRLLQSNWTRTSFDQVILEEGTLSESSFLHASAKNSRLINCDLKNAMLLDAKTGFEITGGTPHEITKPIVALGWYFEGTWVYTSLIREALQDNGALVLIYEQKIMESSLFEDSPLSMEVQAALKKLPVSEQSIVQQLLENAPPNSEIDLLNQTAKEILKYANGLIIPGGEDIESMFYNRAQKIKHFRYRTILEFALLRQANLLGLPTMGVCRGAQLMNVFHGGTLKDVDGHFDECQQLEWTESSQKEKLRKILPKEFSAVSMHDQAIDQVGQGLHVVLKVGEVPKLLLSENGNFIASQVHPEEYFYELKNIAKNLNMENITEEDFETIKKINSSVQQSIQTLQNQHPTSPLTANRYFEQLNRNILSSTQTINFIISNKKIYQFFLGKVEQFRNRAVKSLS